MTYQRNVPSSERSQPPVNATPAQHRPARTTQQNITASLHSKNRQIPQTSEAGIRVTTLDFTNIHQHGELFVNYLKARRETFIDHKGWDLPQVSGMEFDQYDTAQAKWVVLHEYGEILGGIRLTPTTARCGQASYMIRDAQLGLLENIPADILYFEAPIHDKVWEATRLFVSQNVTSVRRLRIQTILMEQMAVTARALGCLYIIGIVPAVFHRWTKRIGMSAFAAGPVLSVGGDRTQAAMMKMKQFGLDAAPLETTRPAAP
ncbi:acyl-homoserine-lactone synthase [Sulfitobacter sp. S190]|uniref:acyl-homoserine-lactone synthase n=1 Tax=Sulfitobacter sp. S190 TaxID=2867022 RepID=UPI0021A6AFA9|nr:acyl-homoserine-lactone synthase [Sulfitobacter sp. S190]UWR21927.1 N-acyl-L-homoserine lactone synthetase [Sulfitobacter sp. S190]